jgi:hypothetical protein
VGLRQGGARTPRGGNTVNRESAGETCRACTRGGWTRILSQLLSSDAYLAGTPKTDWATECSLSCFPATRRGAAAFRQEWELPRPLPGRPPRLPPSPRPGGP